MQKLALLVCDKPEAVLLTSKASKYSSLYLFHQKPMKPKKHFEREDFRSFTNARN